MDPEAAVDPPAAVEPEPDLDTIAADLAAVEDALARLEDGSYEHETSDVASDPS